MPNVQKIEGFGAAQVGALSPSAAAAFEAFRAGPMRDDVQRALRTVSQPAQPAMQPVRDALATGTVRVLVLGDGKPEGIGASSLSSRWPDQVRDTLRARWAMSDRDTGVGYRPVCWSAPGVPNAPTISGTAGTDYVKITNAGGWGSRAVQLSPGTSVTFPAYAARFLRVNYTTAPTGSGTLEVLIDGRLAQTIDTTAADTTNAVAPMIDLGGIAPRVVVLRCKAGTPRVNGVVYRTALDGLHMVEASHDGYRADLYAYGDRSAGAAPAALQSRLLFDSIAALRPNLVIVALGAADMAGAGATPIAPADWRQALGDLFGKIRAAAPACSILFLHGAARVEDARSATATDNPGKIAQFEQAAQSVIDADPLALMLRESAWWQPLGAQPANPARPVEQDPRGWLVDSVHPSEFGAGQIAAGIVQALTGTLDNGVAPQSAALAGKANTSASLFVPGEGAGGAVVTGSWAIPPGAVTLTLETVNGGGGGGSGRRGAAGTVRCGGGGGAAGSLSQVTVRVADLPPGTSTLYYMISPPGAGAPAVTTDDTDGQAGGTQTGVTQIALSPVSTNSIASALVMSWCGSQSNGKGGTATGGAAGTATAGTQMTASGGAASATGGSGAPGFWTSGNDWGPSGGGAGGGITSTNTASSGGGGGYICGTSRGTTNVVGDGVPAIPVVQGSIGTGAGGGNSSLTAAGGNGGRGGDYGGGGGGGAASVNGYPSGAGGNGGRGYIKITARG